ncbi:MAG TPA: ATP-binding protein, partial [Eubacterium sp.]|nr:ATP-binding protein [Eubacterium sp.]
NIPLRASLPVNPELARAMDEGRIEDVRVEELKDLVEAL